MTNPPADPFVGRTIAHYEIVSRLGGGAMGVVYHAVDRKLGRQVALKFLPPQWSHDETARQRFMREAQAASATHHPNICTIHDIESAEDGQLFIVMAYYDGPTLKTRLEAGPLPVEEALEVATQAADGLARAHAQGVVHRDIKPGNLILTEDGVRIVDFGLATFADALQLTVNSGPIGTAAYMSPEQVRGEDVDARTDVWALGVVLYEMLAGRVPFRGTHAEAIAYAIRNDPPPSLRDLRPEVPEEVEQLVFRAMHKDPAIRFASGRELARALRQVRGLTVPQDLRTQVVTPPLATSDPARQRWLRTSVVLTTVLIVLLLGGGATYRWYPLLWPRTPVAIAPVANDGDAKLDDYVLALTQTLIAEISDSPNVRVVPYERVLQMVRRFQQGAGSVSGQQALQAIAVHSGAELIVVPKLRGTGGSWSLRLEVKNPKTLTDVTVLDTDPVISVIAKDAAFELTRAGAAQIEAYFRKHGRGASYALRPPSSRLLSVDAAHAFEQGIDALEALEYKAARSAFAEAIRHDSRHPLPRAYLARVEAVMRRRVVAAEAAEEAARHLTSETPTVEAAFVRAIVAEMRGNAEEAEDRYRELADLRPDETRWLSELAWFLERQERRSEAITVHHQALAQEPRLLRPDLDLCRLYAATTNLVKAAEHGNAALTKYREIGDRGGEAQVLFCLVDTQRQSELAERRQEARRHARAALEIVTSLDYEYNVARAYHYSALADAAEEQLDTAADAWREAASRARATENAMLEAVALMNVGVTNMALGANGTALEQYEAAYKLHETLGNDREAAWTRMNAGAILIEHGTVAQRTQGRQFLEEAMAVAVQEQDARFRLLGHRVMAALDVAEGRLDEAERRLTEARNIASQYDDSEHGPFAEVELAALQLMRGEYAAAREGLLGVLARSDVPPAVTATARIHLGQVYRRLGDVAAAVASLEEAQRDIDRSDWRQLLPVLDFARGEVAREQSAGEARDFFQRAAALADSDYPNIASIEAKAALGALEAAQGRVAAGRTLIERSLQQARTMGRPAVEAQCRLALARIALLRKDVGAAIRELDQISPAFRALLEPELRAQVRLTQSHSLAQNGDAAGAAAALADARDIVNKLQSALAPQDRARFAARRNIREIMQ